MITSDDIRQWIATGRSFKKGLELLALLKGESFLVKMCRLQGNTTFNKKKLDEALDLFIQELTSDPEPAQEPERVPDDGVDFHKLPPDLQALYLEKNSLYREAAYQHRRINSFTGKSTEEPHGIVRIVYTGEQATKRAEAIQIVAKNMKRNGEIWRELDYFQQHGAVPKPPAKIVAVINLDDMPDAELVAYRSRVRNWISKNKSKAGRMPDGEKKTVLLSRIAEKEAEFIGIERRYQEWKDNH